MSKPLESLRFCYFHGVPLEEKEGCLHTLCIPGAFAALSESHLSQSEKKIPLGHMVQLSGAEVSIECILLSFNPFIHSPPR